MFISQLLPAWAYQPQSMTKQSTSRSLRTDSAASVRAWVGQPQVAQNSLNTTGRRSGRGSAFRARRCMSVSRSQSSSSEPAQAVRHATGDAKDSPG